jgi:pimeloyl-ACP methyl ester carboxylesterase
MHQALEALMPTSDKVLLSGSSLGGAVSLSYACSRPEKIDRLVLLSPGGARTDEEDLRAVVSRFDLVTIRDARRLLVTIYHEAPWYMPLVAPALRDHARSRPVREFLNHVTNENALTPEALSRLSMPILLLWGRSERLLPRSHLAWFKAHLPKHAVIEEPDGVGHCAHLDDPRGTAERIVQFASASRQ